MKKILKIPSLLSRRMETFKIFYTRSDIYIHTHIYDNRLLWLFFSVENKDLIDLSENIPIEICHFFLSLISFYLFLFFFFSFSFDTRIEELISEEKNRAARGNN